VAAIADFNQDGQGALLRHESPGAEPTPPLFGPCDKPPSASSWLP
jgi:hypothetical protein